MKAAFLTGTAALVLACPVLAGPLEEACDFAYAQLAAVPHLSLGKSTADFAAENRAYRGCVVRLQGDRTKIKDAHYPAALFYPAEGSVLYRQGWRADREADGPDGTSFRISTQTLFCLVQGRWDGGDDSDPRYVPSIRYEVTVSCSERTR